MASTSATPDRPRSKRSLMAAATLRRLQNRRQPNERKQAQDEDRTPKLHPSETSSPTLPHQLIPTSSSLSHSFAPSPLSPPSLPLANDSLNDERNQSLHAAGLSVRSTLQRTSQQDEATELSAPAAASGPSTVPGRESPIPRNAVEMKRLLNRSTNAQGRDPNSPKEGGLRRDLRRFARSTADLVDSDRDADGYFSAHELRATPRKSESHVRKSSGQYSTSRDGYLSSGAEDKPSSGLRSISRKFFKPASQTNTQGSSPYSWFASNGARQGSYSSASTSHSSPPHTPTTPYSSVELSNSATKDAMVLNGLPQLPPLSSLGVNASGHKDETSLVSTVPSSMGLATSIHTSHLTSTATHSSLAPKTALSITVPTPARTTSVAVDSSPRVTIAPLPQSPSKPYSPVVSSPLASRPGPPSSSSSAARTSPKKESARPASNLPPSSAFDDTSDFLAAVLSFSETGVGSTLFDDTPTSTRSPTEPPSFNTASSSFASFSYQSPLSNGLDTRRGLPRRLTEAQLAEIEQQDRQKPTTPARYTYGRATAQTSYNARPGLFASSHRKGQDTDSEDEYGEADPADSDEDWEAAKKSEPITSVDDTASKKKSKKSGDLTIQTQGLNKPMSGRKASDLMSKASAFLKPRSSASPVSPAPSPPATSAGDSEDGNRPSSVYPSSFSRSRKSPAPSPKPSQDGMNWTPQATTLPGLNSPAKRALYACTLLKVHPQLDSILKVGVSSAAEVGEVAGSVEIRFPRSINSVKKLSAASKFGGSQLGVAGAPITLGSRRLDVALAQTKVMRKLRRRLNRQDEVEIGWFLKGYASEIISPETIAKSLAAKPQVSPEALAKPLMSAQAGEKTPLREASSERPANVDSVAPVTLPEVTKINPRRASATAASSEPNGLGKWVMRKPFLERCVMIRGETEPTFNVGDVVVDAAEATTAILTVSSDTFDSPARKRDSAQFQSAGGSARPGDLVLSPRIRVLAGLSAKPEATTPPTVAKKKEQPSKPPNRAPPPWIAHRQPSTNGTSPIAVPKSQAAHLQAAHDKLVGKPQQPITRAPAESLKFLSPAQALAAEARASLQLRRSSASSASPVNGNSPVHSPAISNGGFDGGETDSNEASGGEYYSAVETEDDDDLPISTLTLRRRPSAVSIGDRGEPSEVRDNGSGTIKGGASPDSKRTMSPLVEEQQRIAALEQELSALKKREHYRESLLCVERARLAKMKADQEAARQLEDHKRQLRQARERRAKTDHSEVLTSRTYGAGDSLAWYEQSSTNRRIRQSSSMADLPAPQLGAAFVSQPSHTGLSAPRSSSQHTLAASPLLGANAATTTALGSVPEGQSMSPSHHGHSSPGRTAERVNKRQSSLPVPPVAASARTSAALGRALSPQPTYGGQFPTSPSQQDMRDMSARRLSSGSSAGHHVGLPRVSSRSNMRSPSPGPGPDAGAPVGLSPHALSSQSKRLSSRPSLSALQAAPSPAMSPRLEPHRATSPTPETAFSMYNMPRGVTSENNLSPGSRASHSGHLSAEQSQQQQWQLFQQWQQMQYMQQQQQLQRAQSHSQVHGLMPTGMPHSATFGGLMGGPQPLVHLGVGDVPSSAISGRYREV